MVTLRVRPALSAALVAALIVVALPSVAAARSQGGAVDPEASSVTFYGGGWGHGVGLSQYGAQAQAAGYSQSYQQILQTYFTGVGFATLGADIADPGPIWVGIRQNLASVDIAVRSLRPEAGFVTVTRGEGETQERQDVFSENTFTVALTEEGCTLAVQDVTWPPGSCAIDVTWDGWEPEPSLVLDIEHRSYARGTLHIRPNKAVEQPTGFHLVMEIDIEQYLYGLAEVPYSWAVEALRTQAVAGRSYAANKMAIREHPVTSPQRQELCWCQLYDSTVDQYYIGYGREDPRWVAAVEDTRGVVMRHQEVFGYDGAPIAVPSFYSSSTFGHTEDSGVAFGSGWTPEFLQGVPDPWSIDPVAGNPYARWEKELSLARLASLLGMESVTGAAIGDCSGLPGPGWSKSQAALEIEFTGVVDGAPATTCFYTRSLRTRLGLRSMQVTRVETNVVFDPQPQVEPVPVYPAALATHDPLTGIWTLRKDDGSTPTFYYGIPDDIPMACDWNGDGVATVGLYRFTEGYLYLRNSNTQGFADISIFYGIPEDLPVCGDWDGDGVETIGIYRPSERRFYLRNSNTQGFGEIEFVVDAPGQVPVAGDWNGDGIDTVGIYDEASRTLSLTNSNTDPAVAVVFAYTGARTGDRILVGDWNADGVDSVGVFRPGNATFYLRDTFTQPSANHVIPFGAAGLNPVAGAWGP